MLRSRPHFEALEGRDMLSRYIVTDLGDFAPRAINQTGVIAGTLNNEPAIWDHGVITDLGMPAGYILAGPLELNDSGIAVGAGIMADFSAHALRWDANGVTELDGIGPHTYALAVNNSGTIVGWTDSSEQSFAHPVMWSSDGGITDLEPGVESTADFAYSINDAGQITGRYQSYAYRWQDGTFETLVTPTGFPSTGSAINARGDVAGSWVYAIDFGTTYSAPAVWTVDGFTNLGLFPGQSQGLAAAMNDAGDVVGYDGSGITGRGFLWHEGTMADVSTLARTPGVTLNAAFGINNAGQILANGRDSGGAVHSFLLTPPTALSPELGWAIMLVHHHEP